MPSESDKWGWKHVSVFGGFDKGSGTKRWKCNHCNLRYNGSYSRVRAHLLGFTGVGVKSCPSIDNTLREAFQILEDERLTQRKKRTSRSGKPGKRIHTSRPGLVASFTKEEVDDIVARFFYADGLNVNVVDSPYFRKMAKAIAAYGPGYEPLSVVELCDSYLSKEKNRIEKSVALVRESWPHTGCTILCISRLESIFGYFHVDTFISSPRGLVFLKSGDIDDIDGAENLLMSVLGDTIMEVGPENVLQIISNLDDSIKLSGSLMLSKFPRIFWSPCTSDSISMLMEEIAQLDWIKPVISCAKEIEECIGMYRHFSPCTFPLNLQESSDTLALKFAPSFCIVQRIFDMKQMLQEVVVSEEWKQWKLSIPEDTDSVEAAILGGDFWSGAHLVLQLFEPCIRLLGTFNVDKCLMGDVYNWWFQALETVRSEGIDGRSLNQLEELVENRWDVLFSPLHAAGYILNPRYLGRGQAKDKTVMRGWKATLERYESDSAGRRFLREQLSSFWRLEGSLGDEDAVDCRDKMDPVAWWENFGFEIPQLQTLAIKVLSQVSSVALCQEIWQNSSFPCRETANRLGVDRVEDLVFVRNNLRLHSQRHGISYVSSTSRNVSSSPSSGMKTWDGAHLDQTMVIAGILEKS